MIFGPLLVLVALFARGGLLRACRRKAAEDAPWLNPCCALEDLHEEFRRPARHRRRDARYPAGRAARRHRPERRRQDHADQPDFRAARSRRRHDPCSTASDMTGLPCTPRAALRLGALVPDHLDPAALLRAGERRARRAGAQRNELSFLRTGRRERTVNEAACAALAEVGLAGREQMLGRRTLAWREARARACDRARDGAEAAAARRADGRHRARRNRAADRRLRG